jgi:hypothetical protein
LAKWRVVKGVKYYHACRREQIYIKFHGRCKKFVEVRELKRIMALLHRLSVSIPNSALKRRGLHLHWNSIHLTLRIGRKNVTN